MKRTVGYGLLFATVLITSVVVHLPAQVVLKPLPLPEGLELNGVEGTLWQGKSAQVRWQGMNFGDLNWDLHLSALLMAQLEADVRFGRGSNMQLRGKGVLGMGINGPYAQNFLLSLPASQAVPWLPLPFPLMAQGQLELTVQQYRFGDPYCQQATGNLVWSAAQVESPLGALDLGTVVSDFSCQESVLNLQGGQKTAQVSSEFTLNLQPDSRYQAQAWFKPEAGFPESLNEPLKWLPQPDGQGRYPFNQQGQL
ncbi:general secretion pathway protein GspN [Vibrio metoecus]|uniref:Type II secretion system protein N n=1 Tax=Vibrio metoecus TaxID=1481663 RepID=A0A0Q0PU23_VIBMT|nr:type II secretion system protein N [Vibrio metoecus]KQB02922.1 general secretion pathway protein GspN [Vibrio metoecus]